MQTITISERGTSTVEFAVTAAFFFMMLIVVVAGGSLFWTHNALVEATRRGARYAANQCHPTDGGCPNSATTVERIKNVVLYNSPVAGTDPFVPHLQPENITVSHTYNFGFSAGSVSVKIEDYDYNFPLSPVPLHMPSYQTTLPGENVGYIPPNR